MKWLLPLVLPVLVSKNHLATTMVLVDLVMVLLPLAAGQIRHLLHLSSRTVSMASVLVLVLSLQVLHLLLLSTTPLPKMAEVPPLVLLLVVDALPTFLLSLLLIRRVISTVLVLVSVAILLPVFVVSLPALLLVSTMVSRVQVQVLILLVLALLLLVLVLVLVFQRMKAMVPQVVLIVLMLRVDRLAKRMVNMVPVLV